MTKAAAGARNTVMGYPKGGRGGLDVYFSADVETDGSIPGRYSMLSFALVYAGAYDGTTFYRPPTYEKTFYIELQPISSNFEQEALNVNGLDRDRLLLEGEDPTIAMSSAADWVRENAGIGSPVIVAYPSASKEGSPALSSRRGHLEREILWLRRYSLQTD